MSTTRTYTLRQKTVTRTNMTLNVLPGVAVHIDGEGMIRGVSAEVAERLLLGTAWELVGGGDSGMRFEAAAKDWRKAKAAEASAREDLREAARRAYIEGTTLEHLMGAVAPAAERKADDWRWLIENEDGTLPEVTGKPDEPVPEIAPAAPQHVAPKAVNRHIQWDASAQAQAAESEAERRAREFGATYIGGEPKRAQVNEQPEPSDPNNLGVTTEAVRGVQIPDDDAPEAPAGDAGPSVAERLDAMSSRALGDVARDLGADLPKRGVGEAAREFLAGLPADTVIEALDARATDKE